MDLDRDSLIAATLADWQARDLTLLKDEATALRLPSLIGEFGGRQPTKEERTDLEELMAQGLLDDRHHLSMEEYLQKIPEEWQHKWAGVEIKTEDWRPEDVRDTHKDEPFRQFILSSIPRFDRLVPYEGFYLYAEQARRWYEETKDVDILMLDDVSAYAHARQEYRRMRVNKLYALNRYVKIRDDAFAKGRPYWAGAPQALLCFLVDRGNSIVLLKGRQAAITSTMMAIVVIDALMRNNYSAVLLTDDKVKTGQDIFSKKVQGTIQLLPEWLRQNIVEALWSKESVTMSFERRTSKVDRGKNSSDINLMAADDPQAVNSKTPTITLFDEVQNIANYSLIKKEVKPTQLSRGADGKMHSVRQQVAWGTGASGDKGKGVFEEDWRATHKALESGKPTAGWVALFFDWTCRPGFTHEDYIQQKNEEIATHIGNDEVAMSIFNAHYPSSPDDSFMKAHNGIVPAVIIKRYRDALTNVPDRLRPVPGLFKPIYDDSRPSRKVGADHRSYIIGSEFVEAKSAHDILNAKVWMFMRPDNKFAGRYFQGTDPIQSATGLSLFASAIWDKWGMEHSGCCGMHEPHLHPTVPCILNGRTHDPKEMFTQSVLMGMYYRNYGQRACKELIEWNQGQDYINYKQEEWVDQSISMILRAELPDRYKRGKQSSTIGFHMTGDSKSNMLVDVESTVYNYGHSIKYLKYFEQLSEIEMEEQEGKKTWGTRDYKRYNDDLVIAITLAKIGADIYNERPQEVGSLSAPITKQRMGYARVETPFGSQLVPQMETYTVRY